MWRGSAVVLLSMLLGTGVLSAQDALTPFEILQPGLTLSVFLEGTCPSDPLEPIGPFVQLCSTTQPDTATDATGALYVLSDVSLPPTECGSLVITGATDVERISGGGALHESLVRMKGCVETAVEAFVYAIRQFTLDSVNGELYVGIAWGPLPATTFLPNAAFVRISGLPTLLDIQATFTPSAGALTWVTPKHPEALPAADRFMVFAGDLRDVHDLRRAAAIDCDVTGGTPPQPGDFLSILDPLPTPQVGQGNFVVIGVDNAGQRRFGRQMIGSVLSGRDPVAFTGCG